MRKLFTVQQANRTLPLVRRIVADIVAQYHELEQLLRQRERLQPLRRAAEISAVDTRAARGTQRLNALIEEVNSIGCELKDWQSGRVDFRSLHDGRDVCLCWKPGEESIRYWHELDAGSSARQPLGPPAARGGVSDRRRTRTAAQDTPA